MCSEETMIWALTQRLLELSPLSPLHRFFSVHKYFAGKYNFFCFQFPPTNTPWATMMLQSLHTCCWLANDLSGYLLKLTTKHCRLWWPTRRMDIAENSTKSRSAIVSSQILSAFFCFASCASHSPPYSYSCDKSFLYPGLSPKFPSVVIVLSPWKCIFHQWCCCGPKSWLSAAA